MQTGEYGYALIYLLAGVAFVLLGMAANRMLAPNRPNPDKLSSYECGEEPQGSAWVQFNMRFYVMGLVFLVFDVEVLLLFPWAVALSGPEAGESGSGWAAFALTEAVVFVAILSLGLAYAWVRGDIDWVKPDPVAPRTESPVPAGLYTQFNRAQEDFRASAPVAGSAGEG